MKTSYSFAITIWYHVLVSVRVYITLLAVRLKNNYSARGETEKNHTARTETEKYHNVPKKYYYSVSYISITME